MANKHKFLKANSYAQSKPIVFCPKDTVLALYNQNPPDGKEMSSLTLKVAKWFHKQSLDYGWSGAVLSPTVGTKHHAGCLLVQEASKAVLVIFAKENQKAV